MTTLAGAPSALDLGSRASMRVADLITLPDGRILIADTWHSQLRVLAADGTVLTLAGTGVRVPLDGPATAAGFRNPGRLASDGKGNVYVAESSTEATVTAPGVRLIDEATTLRRVGADGRVSTVGVYRDLVRSMACDDEGNVLAVLGTGAPSYAWDLVRIRPDGASSTISLPRDSVSNAVAVIAQQNGGLLVADTLSFLDVPAFDAQGFHRGILWRVGPDGQLTRLVDPAPPSGAPAGPQPYTFLPRGLRMAPGGQVFAWEDTRLLRVGMDDASVPLPGRAAALTIDSVGDAVASFDGRTIVKVGRGGAITPLVGSTDSVIAAGSGALSLHGGRLLVPAQGSPWLMDTREVREVSLAGAAAAPGAVLSPSADRFLSGEAARDVAISAIGFDARGDMLVLQVGTDASGWNTWRLARVPRGDGTAQGITLVAEARQSTVLGTIQQYAVGAAGEIILAGDDEVRVIKPDPASRSVYRVQPTIRTRMVLEAVAAGPGGEIVVAEASAVYRLDAAGTSQLLAGSPEGLPGYVDGPGAEARFETIGALTVDPAGRVYVCDTANHAVRRIDRAGRVVTVAGGLPGYKDGVGGAARLQEPVSIALDGAGRLHVLDQGGRVVRLVMVDDASATGTGGP